MENIHPKLLEYKQRFAGGINYSRVTVNSSGQLVSEDSEEFEALLMQRIIRGYLFVWGSKNRHGEKFMRGAFSRSIKERGPNSNSNYKISFLWQHDRTDPLSIFAELEEDDYGLRFRTRPLDDVPNADRCIKQVRSGTINQFSGGFNVADWDKVTYDSASDSIIMHPDSCELWEGSAVTIASDADTHVIRSADSVNELADETELFIRSLPRKFQHEARTLISRNKSFFSQGLIDKKDITKDDPEPMKRVIDYAGLNKLITQQGFKIF